LQSQIAPSQHNKEVEMAVNWADEVIGSHVKGVSFADIGGLWGLVNEKITVAVKAGCRTATMIDMQPSNHRLWEDFDQRAKSAGVTDYQKLQGNLDDPTLSDSAGTFDFVHCSGVIYHVPNPLYTLARLHELTRRYLLLVSMTVPQRISTAIGEVSFTGGRTVFLPAVDTLTKAILAHHFKSLGINLSGISDDQYPWASLSAYGPWWWLWTPDTLCKMLQITGFRVIETCETWVGRAHGLLCEKQT
jgi:Methyltransferase domain